MADYMEIGTLRCTSDLDTQAGFYGFRDFSLSNVDVTGDAPFFSSNLNGKKEEKKKKKGKKIDRDASYLWKRRRLIRYCDL